MGNLRPKSSRAIGKGLARISSQLIDRALATRFLKVPFNPGEVECVDQLFELGGERIDLLSQEREQVCDTKATFSFDIKGLVFVIAHVPCWVVTVGWGAGRLRG